MTMIVFNYMLFLSTHPASGHHKKLNGNLCAKAESVITRQSLFSLDNNRPALGTLNITVLDIHDRVVDALSQLSSLAGLVRGVKRDMDVVAIVVDLLDRADNASSSGT